MGDPIASVLKRRASRWSACLRAAVGLCLLAGGVCDLLAQDANQSETTTSGTRQDSAQPKSAWTDFPQTRDGAYRLWKSVELTQEDSRWRIAGKHFFKDGGEVTLRDEVLQLGEGSPGTGLVANFEVPRIDYELEFEARRTQGSDFFCGLTFPFQDQQATLILGGWGGRAAGISNVNRFPAIENSTSRTVPFENQRWYKVRFRVTEEVIECFLDDESLFWLDPLDKKLETWWEQKPMEPLGIACWNSAAEIRHLRLRKIPEQ